MALLTITQFAALHNVTRQAVQSRVAAGKIAHKILYGRALINSKAKYTPILGRGRKSSKTKRK